MYKLLVSYDELIAALSANHKVVNKSAVRKAYNYASEKHKNQTRKTGEAYIMHPLRVAKFIAEWGLESDVVVAALLHDIVEDCNTPISEIEEEFGSNVAKMVDALTAVNSDLEKAKGKTKEEIDKMSDARLIRKVDETALLIKAADRLDNLYTISGVPEKKQFGKAQHTREILIPLMKREGAFMLIEELENLCFKIEHKERYHNIMTIYNNILSQNAVTTKKVLDTLNKTLKKDSNYILQNELVAYKNCIINFTYNTRSAMSIYRHLIRKATNLDKELPNLLIKSHTPLYDLTLITKNKFSEDVSATRPLDIFFKFYEKSLIDEGICIADCCKTTHGDADYLLLHDDMDNYYRLFIKSEEDYMRYNLGCIIDDKGAFSFSDVYDGAPTDAYNTKIKVFKRDGSELYIDAGSTVLDFAFAIHSDLGLHFDYALIDNSQTQFPAYTKLNEGDKITIITKEDMAAKIQWFRYVKTSKAVDYLVKQFG